MKKEEEKIVKALDNLFKKYDASLIKPILQHVLHADHTQPSVARCGPGYRWSEALGRCLADPLD